MSLQTGGEEVKAVTWLTVLAPDSWGSSDRDQDRETGPELCRGIQLVHRIRESTISVLFPFEF